MMEIKRKVRHIEKVDPKLKPIVMVLQDHEEILSDGYGYYCRLFAEDNMEKYGDSDYVTAALEKIAQKILDKIEAR